MPKRLLRRTIGELSDFLGFVSLCIPDMFPDDEDAELGPKNMGEAFEDIYAAVAYIKANDKRNRAKVENLLPALRKAEKFSQAENFKECLAMLEQVRKSLVASGQDVGVNAASLSPREQGNLLLNEAIETSQKLISHMGSHIPFAKVLSTDGNVETIVADDSEVQDPTVLISTLVDAVGERSDLRAIALSTNVDYLEPEGGKRVDAVMVDLDHKEDRPVTCVLPYELGASGQLSFGELFAIEAKRTFFSREQKIRAAD